MTRLPARLRRLAFLLTAFTLAPAALAQDVSGPAHASDGDTLNLTGIIVRIHGIDAPELAQNCNRAGSSWACGREAADRLASLVAGKMWSYVGTRDPGDPRVARLGIASHVTADYPPTFISVGNADPLAPQSVAFADALRAKGVEVDNLFFPSDHKPPLEHEYQLLLSTEAGQRALDRYTKFLAAHASTTASVTSH